MEVSRVWVCSEGRAAMRESWGVTPRFAGMSTPVQQPVHDTVLTDLQPLSAELLLSFRQPYWTRPKMTTVAFFPYGIHQRSNNPDQLWGTGQALVA